MTANFDPDVHPVSRDHIRLEIEKPSANGRHMEGVSPEGASEGGEVQEYSDDDEFSPGRTMENYDPTLELPGYKFPNLDLLDDHKAGNAEVSNEELISNKNKIVETLRQYKIEITKIRATIGPTITLYEIVPAPASGLSRSRTWKMILP